MSENEPRPAENPYGSQPPTNPYGQPVPPSEGEAPTSAQGPSQGAPSGSSQDWPQAPGPRQDWPEAPAPQQDWSQAPQGGHGHPQGGASQMDYSRAQQGGDPYGQPYGAGQQGGYQGGYQGGHRPGGDQRPGTVTAAGWTTIVMSALSLLLFGFMALVFLVAQDPVIDEMRRQPGFDTLEVDPGSIVGVIVAVMLVFAIWSAIGVVLGIFVLRRSNVARILLVISSAVVVLLSLVGIASVVSAVTLLAAGAVIVLLFVGGAGDWFAHRNQAPYAGGPYDGPSSYNGPSAPYGG